MRTINLIERRLKGAREMMIAVERLRAQELCTRIPTTRVLLLSYLLRI